MKKRYKLVLLAASLGFTLPTINAQDSPESSESWLNSGGWEFTLEPYGLAASIDGDAGLGRVAAAPVAVDASTILENLEVGAMLHAEARKDKWGLMLDLIYVKLGLAGSTPRGGIADVEIEQLVAESFLSYRIGNERWLVDVYGGARHWDIDVDLQLTGLGTTTLSRGDNWWDPVVGARAVRRLNDKWSLSLRGDIGGFGIASDFTWQASSGVGYDFTDWFSLSVHYRALGVDYDNDVPSGSPGFFAYDTITHGPQVGFMFKF